MKILFLSWENFATADILNAFRAAGHEYSLCDTSQEELLNPAITEKVTRMMKEASCDIVFGFNFFPYVAEAAHASGFEYYSWVYDNPSVQIYSMAVRYPENHVFVFDSDTWFRFKEMGFDNISFLPMAADPDRLKALNGSKDPSGQDDDGYINDIAFVGSLYNEKNNFFDRMIAKGLPPYTEGYLSGIMEAQKQVYGINLPLSLLTDPVIEDMYKALPLEPDDSSFITKRILFADFCINRKITAEERLNMLKGIGETFGSPAKDRDAYRISLYTGNRNLQIRGVINRGNADAYEGTPVIYYRSKINLNISLRSIVNGIPLRCFDILGAGGFLLTSYAADMDLFFKDGEDYVSFSSPEDLIDKCGYYLKHEDERAAIAANGVEKIRQAHTFTQRVREMFGE